MDYKEMLQRAKKMLPESTVATGERFEIPKVKGHVEGNKTIIINFISICQTFRRDPSHLLKYLQRELATPAKVDDQRLILGRKLNSSLVNQKVADYANNFVICPDCKKPDTQVAKEGIVLVMKCTACGAKHPIKTKI